MSRIATPARSRRLTVLSKWRIGLMLFAALAVVALTADLVTLRLRAARVLKGDGLASLVSEALIDVSTATNRWRDPAGRFSVVWPPGWEPAEGNAEIYDLTLRGPYRLEMSVAVRDAEAGGPAAFEAKLRQIEEQLHLKTSLEAITYQGQPAWRRTMPLQKSTVEALDYLAGSRAVHVLVSGNPETFSDFRPVLVELRDSLEVLP